MLFQHQGNCPICERDVMFSADTAWFRDSLRCSGCGSIPRERALFKVLKDYFPNYRELYIHESSPANRGASPKLKGACVNYSSSHYLPEVPRGNVEPKTGVRCESLEELTFSDESFDVFVTQDVMEHIFDYDRAFKEIARVLKPGGAHIFSVPLVNKLNRSESWASRDSTGQITYHHPAQYHGNPVDANGSLVTMHWGYDIASRIMVTAQMPTTIILIDNIDLGIRAEFIEILISVKL